jgi:hypothetical protein
MGNHHEYKNSSTDAEIVIYLCTSLYFTVVSMQSTYSKMSDITFYWICKHKGKIITETTRVLPDIKHLHLSFLLAYF